MREARTFPSPPSTLTLAFKSTAPSTPKSVASCPVLTSTAIMRPSRGAGVEAGAGLRVARPVGQAARATCPGLENFHSTFAVSGSSAKMLVARRHIHHAVDHERRHLHPARPVSNVHARVSVATFCGVIWVSGENRCAPGSRPSTASHRKALPPQEQVRSSPRAPGPCSDSAPRAADP